VVHWRDTHDAGGTRLWRAGVPNRAEGEAELATRERAAERRDLRSRVRERMADEREIEADERERLADDREKRADDRERVADERDVQAGERGRPDEAPDGSPSTATTEAARAAQLRSDDHAQRDQQEIDRAWSRTRRRRQFSSPHEH
jgi:hypothetical protein